MRLQTLGATLLVTLFASTTSAAPIVDYSGLPVNGSNNGFGSVGGVQFLNPTTFQLESVQILLGLDNPGVANFHIFEFDGSVGDTTGTLIGTISGVSVQDLPFEDFATKSTTIDVSSLGLTLLAGTVYGFTLQAASGVRGGSTGDLSTSANIGTIFAGDLAGNFSALQEYEIPFIASGTATATLVPEPASLILLGSSVTGTLVRHYRRKS